MAKSPLICAGGGSCRGGGTVDTEMGKICGRLDGENCVCGGGAGVGMLVIIDHCSCFSLGSENVQKFCGLICILDPGTAESLFFG